MVQREAEGRLQWNLASALSFAAAYRSFATFLTIPPAHTPPALLVCSSQVLGLRHGSDASAVVAAGSAQLVVLDGAHTRESAAALRETLAAAFPGHPLALVLAMASDKEHRAVVDELRGCDALKVVIFTSVAIGGSTDRSCAPGV